MYIDMGILNDRFPKLIEELSMAFFSILTLPTRTGEYRLVYKVTDQKSVTLKTCFLPKGHKPSQVAA